MGNPPSANASGEVKDRELHMTVSTEVWVRRFELLSACGTCENFDAPATATDEQRNWLYVGPEANGPICEE
jgi:hypothetical protein